jgi:hypothetical protein
MGGKSRKSGGVSKRLIDILKNQSGKGNGNKTSNKPGFFNATEIHGTTSGSNGKKRD